LVVLAAVFEASGVIGALHDAQLRGQALAAMTPIVMEATGVVAAIACWPFIIAVAHRVPLSWSAWPARLGIHALATLAYSAVHFGLMTLLRVGACRAFAIPYNWSWAAWPYEYQRDALAYVGVAALFWLLRRARQQRLPAQAQLETALSAPITFDIVDSGTTWRTRVADIVAVRAAGNYVDFLLAEGRTRLMHVPLGRVEAELGRGGLVRTHRSWLVNPAHVRAFVPSRNGDFRLDLEGGVRAPVSRRYPAALAKLRDGG
jgi:hypothetical protein